MIHIKRERRLAPAVFSMQFSLQVLAALREFPPLRQSPGQALARLAEQPGLPPFFRRSW
ncbi:hypothetical protein HY414_00520 [Candidatus Kaiserbacteria bacterium]|nr:hypothetical protein [Candidatus Kaiserbacteria bacterium]